MSKETFTFQTEVSRLLDIVAGSLYSNREIFLRELISNASDACDKLRHMALTSPSLIEGDQDFKISLAIDEKAKTITVSDNGIGMNHDDLLATLGTIASSGTGAFIEQLGKDDKKNMGLIGQFGVGFYSAFMVSDKVEVTTRKAGEKESWLWVSDGKGEYTIESAERSERGTQVVLHLKKDAKEFLDASRVTHVVKTYSDHIGFPVTLTDSEGGKTLNEASAIWTRPVKDVTAEQYKEFYHHSAHAFDDPWITMHNRIEGVVSYTNLLFIPSMRPFDLFDPERKGHVKLYVNRVFITEQAEGLLPPYLRFLRGVVDSEDLSLNISREMLQTDPKLAKIRNGLVKKVLAELAKKAEKAPEDYAQFWENFGVVLKEGLVDDFTMRDKLLALARFHSTKAEELTSLSAYVERMKEGQEAIYYITGEDASQIATSPHLEGFKAKGVEVLMLTDPVDEFWMQHITQFEDKPFKSVTRGSADLDGVKSDDSADADADKKAEDAPALDTLIAAFKLELGASVKDIRPSKRLTESPVCLVADEGDIDVNMERLLRRHGQMQGGLPRVLELNPTHAIVKKLAERASSDADDGLLKDAAHLLLDQARIAEGEVPSDPAAFAKRLASVMERAL
ncbi:molecular chaperone HtpG [Magnetovibrio blakemorei]|uniref:Chaperone protein HtpG n=1 Tax=Magnetovibrio blakemorei TaxID=28181 RepID=A0A1E5QC84_9PROT|nr:molecular chaperone HtpG [Magnetovibrio blakemorei]OEJ69690.1 molecular chaperone HtpG [Magnetovibrio blakemorei]